MDDQLSLSILTVAILACIIAVVELTDSMKKGIVDEVAQQILSLSHLEVHMEGGAEGGVQLPQVPTTTLDAKGLEGTGISLPVNFHGNLQAAHSDQQLKDLLKQAKDAKQTAIVSYGASWCHACRQMLPTFCNLSNEYPKSLFIYTDIDECPQETQDVRYTPTFRFYREGDKVDEFYGAGPQRLRDRVWLQA